MHPTADTLDVINSKDAGRRVMPGVMLLSLEAVICKRTNYEKEER
jgi:hypothetical protein